MTRTLVTDLVWVPHCISGVNRFDNDLRKGSKGDSLLSLSLGRRQLLPDELAEHLMHRMFRSISAGQHTYSPHIKTTLPLLWRLELPHRVAVWTSEGG